MLCPNCTERTRVIGTDTSFENIRYRRCPACGHSFTTSEKVLGAVNTHLATKVGNNKGMTDTVVQEYTS